MIERLKLYQPPNRLVIPFRGRGRLSVEQRERELGFADNLISLARSLDFKLSSRGWCYYLEPHGLAKGDFDKAESLINSLREDGILPIDIVASSQQRVVEGLENVSEHETAEAYTKYLAAEVLPGFAEEWTPESQWETQENYIELVVEKIDLVGLFSPIAYEEFGVTVTNMQGWSDPLTRATQMKRFVEHYEAGRCPIVLYFTDHDPDGLRIAHFLKEHYDNLARVYWMDGSKIEWTADSVGVERIGLSREMIESWSLTWIDGLVTGSGKDLGSPSHPNHNFDYVQEYIREHGKRKVEANALVTRVNEARQWLRGILSNYIDASVLNDYNARLETKRQGIYCPSLGLCGLTR
jgi:hypothetical protein